MFGGQHAVGRLLNTREVDDLSAWGDSSKFSGRWQ